MLLAIAGMFGVTSCGESADACSCKKAAEELAEKIKEAGTDADAITKLNDDAKAFADECTAAAEKAGEDGWKCEE